MIFIANLAELFLVLVVSYLLAFKLIPRFFVGLGRVLGFAMKPTPLTDEEVNQILHQSVATQEKPRPTEVFDKGERIRITDGPFASFNGVVEEVNFDRSTVKVMVTIFGRETPVEMEFRQVQKLT